LGFATAVDATLAGTDGTSAKKSAPPPNGNGTPNLTSPIFAPDILVAGPNEDVTLSAETPKGQSALFRSLPAETPKDQSALVSSLPAETPKDQSALVPSSPAETPKDQSALVPSSPQVTGREPLPSTRPAEAKPTVPDDGTGRDVQGRPEVLVQLKNETKQVSKAGESAEESPLPHATRQVVLARAIDRSGPGRGAQPSERTPDANAAEKDDEPPVAGKAETTIASPQTLPLPVPKVHDQALDNKGGVDRDPGTGKGAVTASHGHSARETEPRVVTGTLASRDGDAGGFALPPSATDKADIRPTAPGFAAAQAARAEFDVPEPKAQAAAQPVVTAQPGRIGQDLGVEIARRIAAGGDQLVVRLSPAELGRIEVRMSFDDRGGLSTVFAADSRAALDMLRRDSADLSRALNDAGFRNETNTMRFDSGDRGSGGQPRTPWQNAAPKRDSGTDTFEPELIDQTAFRTLQTRGRYDLMA
jgi:flagellar hook-length control protein FliK